MVGTKERPRILLIDDDKLTQAQFKNILAADYQLHISDDGTAGMRAVNDFKPDLILSAIQLPRLSGTQLLQHVRANNETCSLPFMLLSDPEDGDLRVEGLNAGVICLIKPLSDNEIVTRISTQLLMHKLQNCR